MRLSARCIGRWARLALTWCAILVAAPCAAQAAEPFHLVLVLTDDQRFDTLWAMPILQRKVVRHGVRFSNALVTTPLCCPMRASLLSGGYLAQNTGVLANPPFGGDAQFVDADTLPLVLQRAGYRTQLVGKYLNGWQHPHIPRGWTEFSVWGSQSYTLGSSAEEPGTGQYVPYTGFRVDAQRDRVIQFIDQHLPSGHPLFIVFAPVEPHYPAFPAPQDEDLFPGYVFRERAYEPGSYTVGLFNSVEEEDEFHRDQLRSLQSVDRAIGAIVERLKKARQLKRTVFVFASDNGYLWGEHGEFTKKSPWEESIRVPLVVMAPGARRRTDKNLVAVNLDVPATFLDFAGLPAMGDGASLRELLKDRRAPWREEILIEHFERTWAGLRTRDRSRREWKYVESVDGDPQLFDLVADPYELTNLASLPEYQPIVQDFAARLAPQKGVASLHYAASVPVRFGNPFALEIGAWGGRPPFTWRILSGHLPLGLSLDESTGTISGVALEIAANVRIEYELTGSRVLPQARRLERYRNAIEFHVLSSDFDHDGARDAVDNCPFHSNPGQQDTDRDGVGDACFACSDGVDNDGDGRVDFDGGASRNGGVAVTPRDLGCSLQAQRTSEVSAPALR